MLAQSNPKIPKLGRLELDGFNLDLDYFLGFDYDDVSAASIELPPVIEWVNIQLQSMNESKFKADDKVKETEAMVYMAMHQGLYEDRGYAGRKNALALNHAVALDERVIKAKEDFAVLAAWCGRLYNLQASLQSKLELVRSAGAARRAAYGLSQQASSPQS